MWIAIRPLLSAFLAIALVVAPAIAQAWRSSVGTNPVSDAPVAEATVNAGGEVYGWDLVAWCGPDELGTNWNIRIETHDIIDSHNPRHEVTIRFDKKNPETFEGIVGGSYSNILYLTSGYDEPIDRLLELVRQLKDSSSFAVQIGSSSKVFSLSGSNLALSRWVSHCKLDKLKNNISVSKASVDESPELAPANKLEGIY